MRGRDLLVGCGLGCLGLVVLGVAGCVGFRFWLESPAELLEPERLFAAETAGYVELRLSLEDPSTARFVDEVLAQMDPPETADLPRWARSLIELQNRRRARQLHEMFPAVLAWTSMPGPGEEDHQVISLSSEGIGNRLTLARWILGLALRRSGDVALVEYRGESLVLLPSGDGAETTLVLRRGDIHFASSPEAAERTVDRLVRSPGADAGPRSELERLFDSLPSERPLRGVISNQRGELIRLLRSFEETDLAVLEGVRSLTVQGEFSGGSSLDGALELRGASGRWAETHADALAELLARDWGALRPVVDDPEVAGEWVRIRFVLSAPVELFDGERPTVVEAPAGGDGG